MKVTLTKTNSNRTVIIDGLFLNAEPILVVINNVNECIKRFTNKKIAIKSIEKNPIDVLYMLYNCSHRSETTKNERKSFNIDVLPYKDGEKTNVSVLSNVDRNKKYKIELTNKNGNVIIGIE